MPKLRLLQVPCKIRSPLKLGFSLLPRGGKTVCVHLRSIQLTLDSIHPLGNSAGIDCFILLRRKEHALWINVSHLKQHRTHLGIGSCNSLAATTILLDRRRRRRQTPTQPRLERWLILPQ
jgi:hypothetical protein